MDIWFFVKLLIVFVLSYNLLYWARSKNKTLFGLHIGDTLAAVCIVMFITQFI